MWRLRLRSEDATVTGGYYTWSVPKFTKSKTLIGWCAAFAMNEIDFSKNVLPQSIIVQGVTYAVPDMTQATCQDLATWISNNTLSYLFCEYNTASNRLSFRNTSLLSSVVISASPLLGVSTQLTIPAGTIIEAQKAPLLNWTTSILVHANFVRRSYSSIAMGGVDRGDVLTEIPISADKNSQGIVFNGRQDDAHLIVDEETNSLNCIGIYLTDSDGTLLLPNTNFVITLNFRHFEL